MNKNICYKEWAKTRRIFFVLLVFMLAAFVFESAKMYIAGREVGNLYLWQLMILKNMVPFMTLKFFPILVGVLIAWAQFGPELGKKRLKLTLHLPLSHNKVISDMLLFGGILVLIINVLSFGLFILWCITIYPYEVIIAWVYTALPLIISSCVAYLSMVWVMIEPKWSQRIINVLVALGALSLFFLSHEPTAYNPSLWILALLIPLFGSFVWISLRHFVDGIE